jgi:hypothetical protein
MAGMAAATGGNGGAEMRGGGKGGGNAEWRLYLLLASFILLYLGKASEIWEVLRKLPGSRQDVPRKSPGSPVSIVTGLLVKPGHKRAP